MNYTPGPWSVDRPYIRGAERVIAALEPGRNEVEDAANARLLAAAPELYEALRDLFEAVVIPEEISIEAGFKARIRARDILLKLREEEKENA